MSMKGASNVKSNHKHQRSTKDMPLALNSHTSEHILSQANLTPDEVIHSQTQYIDNLQQQIYFLENEIGCLRNHLDISSKSHPTMLAEAEKMVKKLSDSQKEIQNLKVELKRKQTNVDLFKSEKQRLLRKIADAEALLYKHQNSSLEEIIELKKEKDECLEKSLEYERLMNEIKQQQCNIQEDYDNLYTQTEQLKLEMTHDKELISSLKKEKEELQKDLLETKMQLEAKQMTNKEEALDILKKEIQQLHEQLTTAGRTAEHERLLRNRLSEDNALLIKRHADLETEVAEVKALLREEQSLRNSFENVHLKLVTESSEIKSRETTLKAEIDDCNNLLRTEKERCLQLASQLSDEQRFRIREEEKVAYLEKRLDERNARIKVRERENTELQRDNAVFQDQILLLRQQLTDRENEVDTLKHRVQEMQVSVEEFTQSYKAANRLEGQRWKQLTQLAEGIQSLSKAAMLEQDP